MRILLINSVCGIRSTGRICTDLAVSLERQGNKVKIGYGRESVPDEYAHFAVRIGSDTDVRLHGLKARTFDAMGYGSKRATEVFIRWVKEFDPDVIHLHNIHGYYIHIETLFSYLKTCKKRILWTQHDCWAFTGHSAYCDGVGCDRWQSGCCRCPQHLDYPKSLFDFSKRNWQTKKALFTGVRDMTLVTPSVWLKDLVKQSFLREYPVEVICNRIDTEIFRPRESDFRQKYALQNKTVLLGVAAQWEKRKGLDDMIRLSGMLDDSFRVVLVGQLPKKHPVIPDKILVIPSVESPDALAQIYTAADVLINPTYQDNYPTVNLEAIACNTPVITYDTGGSPESAAYFGAVVPKGDVEALARAAKDYSAIRPVGSLSLAKSAMLKEYGDLYGISL